MRVLAKSVKQYFSLSVFLLAVIFGFFVNHTETAVKASAKYYNSLPKVIIDAGHGGFDGGAVAFDGTNEKDINLKIAKKLETVLKFYGFSTVMTRTSDDAINDSGDGIRSQKKSDMYNRLRFMEKNPDAVFVSIHLNKYTTSAASGAQTFYSENFASSKTLADNIQKSIASLLEPYNKRVVKKGTSDAFLLYNAKTPAVIVECGFLSNRQDLEQLKSDDFQNKMAFAIANGIINYY